MRPFITRLSTVFLLSGLCATARSQTIPISTSTSAFAGINSCSGCTITLDPGVVLTVNSNVTCTNCTFIGGTIIFSSGSVQLNTTCTFKNDTVLINTPLNIQSMNFDGDSVAVNSSLTYSKNGTTINKSNISIGATTAFNSVTMTGDTIHAAAAISSNAAALTNTVLTMSGTSTFNATGTTVTGGDIIMNGTANTFNANSTLTIASTDITINSTGLLTSSGALSITGGAITSAGKISTGSSITLAGDTVTMTAGYLFGSNITAKANGTKGNIITMSGAAHDSTNGTLALSNTVLKMNDSSYMISSSSTLTSDSLTMNTKASLRPQNGLTVTSSGIQMNDSTYITAGSMTIQTGSYVTVGNGLSTSKANIVIQNGLKVLDTSNLAVSGGNNSFASGNNTFSVTSGSKPVPGNLNCGGAGQNACKTQTVFGCATLNSGGAVACTVLGVADLDLKAAPAGDNAVDLSWSDPQYASAAQYLVQRSPAGGDWITLATIDANGYAAGNDRFEDAAAPAGTDNYRIARIDQYGAIIYSPVSSVTLASTTSAITIFPNPAAGHTFNISVPSTDRLTLNVYTLTGQLITHTTLQGQTRYPVRLPSQLPPATTVIVQTILQEKTASFPLFLR